MIIFLVWIPLLESLVIPTEPQKDRYVLREHESFEMDCNHKLQTVTRVTWEFVSTNNNNRSETIYDSQQPNNILKSGFEVSCQPHETFISTCILKLVQARKEDSGNYICYVGQGNQTKFDSNLLKPITEIELVIRGPIHKTVLVNKAASVNLPCEHNIKNLTRARWSHVSLQGVTTYSLFHLPAKQTINANYEVLCEPHELSCNFKILQANKESAGRYICLVGDSLEFEEKYGLDQMTHFIEIELVIGELDCNENMNKGLTLIGENDCYGMEADVLNLKCSFNYFGNINYNLLHLRWIEKYKFNSLKKKLNSSLINHETNRISIQTNLSVAYEMQNSIFQCVLDDTKVKPCQLKEFRTQYVKNTTENPPSINSDELQNKMCTANKSANVQCSYYWTHETPGAILDNPFLPVENIKSPGIYTCFAKCQLASHKDDCIIKAMQFEVIEGSHASIIVVIVIILLVAIMAVIVGVVVYMRKRLFSQCKARFNRSNREDDGNTSLKLLENSNNVGDILYQERTKHHNIKIYDSANKRHGRMLMIDGTLWDAEKDDFSDSRLRTMLPFDIHPNPKNVLVIGGGHVGILKEMLKNSEVESITLCEIDEKVLKRCKEFFPSLTSCLDDGKVSVHNGDGFMYMKGYKNAFDVIINHSSDLQGPSEYLFTNEYYETVITALKDGGVTSSIFGCTYDIGSHVIENLKDFCKQLFPAVEYFDEPKCDQPSSLIRCLMCSTRTGTNFIDFWNEKHGKIVEAKIKRAKEELEKTLLEFTSNNICIEKDTLDQGTNKVNEKDIIREEPKSCFPLKEKKILVKENTKHYDIKIYESISATHGKVLVIDGAIQELEGSDPKCLEEMMLLFLTRRPNPNKVLVIGRGEGRTLGGLLKHSGMNSVTVYEMDQRVLDLYCEHFPKLASSLKDAKVNLTVGDGINFLKNQTNVFDIIISHSSSCKNADDYMFTKEYFDVLKPALTEGGIACLYVTGTDEVGYDVIERTVMNFCKQLFPVVQYFDIPYFNQPCAVVRYLMCSLNPEINFKGPYECLRENYVASLKNRTKRNAVGKGRISIQSQKELGDSVDHQNMKTWV